MTASLSGRRCVPLLASAVVIALAKERGGEWTLGLIGLVPLFQVIHARRPTEAARCGVLWGSALAITMRIVGDPAAHWPTLVALPLFSCVYAFGASALTRWIGFSPLILGVGWAAVEFGLSALGLRLGLLAATQADGWMMQQVGTLLGYVFVAFLVAYVNATLTRVLERIYPKVSSSVVRASAIECWRLIWQPPRDRRLCVFKLHPSLPRPPPAVALFG